MIFLIFCAFTKKGTGGEGVWTICRFKGGLGKKEGGGSGGKPNELYYFAYFGPPKETLRNSKSRWKNNTKK